MNEHWNDLWSSLSKECGPSKLWRIYIGLTRKLKERQPSFSTLPLTDDPAKVEHQLITTSFPTASLIQPPALPIIQITYSCRALGGHRAGRSAPGHDGIAWQQIANMDDFTLTQLATGEGRGPRLPEAYPRRSHSQTRPKHHH